MPLYVFECSACRHRFEDLVRPDEQPDCPECGARRTERPLPRVAVLSGSRSAPDPAMGPCGSCPDAGAPGGCRFEG